MYNPALREQPREEPASVIPPRENGTILDWLETTGRLLERESTDSYFKEDEAEINDLMVGEDDGYDDDDDDVLDVDDD
jgi:hypothetical protein